MSFHGCNKITFQNKREILSLVEQKFISCCIFALVILFLTSCTHHFERPYGWLRLGKVKDLLAKEIFLKNKGILLRRDNRGFYAMSTLCTYDGSPLELKIENGKKVFVSNYTTSKYDYEGNVLSGPAKYPLPYYYLKIDAGTVQVKDDHLIAKKDTLYVYIGRKVSKDWRLPFSAKVSK